MTLTRQQLNHRRLNIALVVLLSVTWTWVVITGIISGHPFWFSLILDPPLIAYFLITMPRKR